MSLDIPSGPFVNEDLRAAADVLERLRAREKLLESVIERQALGLMKIRTMQGNPVQIARDAMDESAHEQKPCPWCGVVHDGGCGRMISGGQSD